MRVVILAQDEIINDIPRRAGELVIVSNNFDGEVRRVIHRDIATANRARVERKRAEVRDRQEGRDRPANGNGGRDR